MGRTFDILGDLRQANRGLRDHLATVGGAKSPEMIGEAIVLRNAWRKVLSVKGAGRPSSPGEAPRRQKGVLARSVAQGIVGTGRRVGLTRFTATILEEGADTRRPTASGRRRSKARQGYQIRPRPSAARALEIARPDMGTTFAERSAARMPAAF